jgi:hypothetical protein
MKLTRIIYALLAAVVLVPAAAGAASAPTSTSKLYLQPASATVAAGSELHVAVRVTSTEAVNAVQSNLNYPANILEYESVDSTGTAFDVTAPTKGGSGSVQIARGAMKPVTGDALVATVVFKAIAHGSASVEFAAGSAVPRSADAKDTLGTRTGGNYTVTGGPAPASLAPTPAGGATAAGSAGTPSPKPALTRALSLGTSTPATGVVVLLVLLGAAVAGWVLWRRRQTGQTPPTPPTDLPKQSS